MIIDFLCNSQEYVLEKANTSLIPASILTLISIQFARYIVSSKNIYASRKFRDSYMSLVVFTFKCLCSLFLVVYQLMVLKPIILVIMDDRFYLITTIIVLIFIAILTVFNIRHDISLFYKIFDIEGNFNVINLVLSSINAMFFICSSLGLVVEQMKFVNFVYFSAVIPIIIHFTQSLMLFYWFLVSSLEVQHYKKDQ